MKRPDMNLPAPIICSFLRHTYSFRLLEYGLQCRGGKNSGLEASGVSGVPFYQSFDLLVRS